MDLGSTLHQTGVAGLDQKACWELLERVAASTHLNRAARLREFLFYVSKKCLTDGSEVHEQEIGSAVFGRQAQYDTSQDNIVRVNATELRKRISAYFAAEGIEEPLIFDIPRGSYTPTFRNRVKEMASLPGVPVVLAPVVESEPLIVPVVVARTPPSNSVPFLLALAVALLLAVVCAMQWGQNRSLAAALSPWKTQPAISAFWGRFLDSGQSTDVVLADAMITTLQDITGQPLSLSDYVNRSYVREIQSMDLSADRKSDLTMVVSRMNTTFGDLRAAGRIQQLDPASKALSLQFAREYNADSIKLHNVILIGGQKANPWVGLFDDRLNFAIEYDAKLNLDSVRNRHPRAGEQATYAAPVNQYTSVGYSYIAYLPNPSHTHDALIISGTDSQATYAAAEFLTSEASLTSFLKLLNTKDVPHFEVLLRNTRLSSTPFDVEVVAYRID